MKKLLREYVGLWHEYPWTLAAAHAIFAASQVVWALLFWAPPLVSILSLVVLYLSIGALLPLAAMLDKRGKP